MNDKLQRLRDYLFGTTKQVTEQLPYANVTKSVPDQPNIVQRAIGSIGNLLSKVGDSTVNITPQQQYNQPTPSPAPSGIEQYKKSFRISIPYSQDSSQLTDVPTYIAQQIGNQFDDIQQATNAATVLHHPLQDQVIGQGRGENAQFITGKGWNDYNYNNKGDVKYITNPFTGEQEKSEDRGLFRINNATFYELLKRKPRQMAKIGLNGPQDYEKMYDPASNIAVARLIFDEGGWGRWFAAPKSLVNGNVASSE